MFRNNPTPMRHCVSSLAHGVAIGAGYIFHMSKDDAPIATIEIHRNVRDRSRAEVGQVRGPCNALPDKLALAAVSKWFRRADIVVPKDEPIDDLGALDDEIPF